MHVIGTAGHVDHGKSALVQALTGIDPDRLQEEKDRGLTIDLGFAWLTLPSGEEVSIVDVPGHERFIKNMLAGVGGIDLALLVVACDEGIMPQTREHLAILDLLGVERGVVALAKRDLVDQQWLGLVCADVEELLDGTTLKGSPLVPCSARTRDGLTELLQAVETALSSTPPAADRARPRLPIDRVFTMSGFGTVVTGTLLDGSLNVGDEVEILPSNRRARVRGLQNHKQKTGTAHPGRRTAVNLAGVSTDELERGMQLARPGMLSLSSLADVRLRILPAQSVRHGARLMIHHFAAEVEARLSLLEDERLSGSEGWAQLRLASPLPLVRGDRFVVRAGGETLGGGQVVDIAARRHRRGHGATLERLARLQNGAAAGILSQLAQLEPCLVDTLLRNADRPEEAGAALEEEIAAGRVIQAGDWLLSRSGHDALRTRAVAAIGVYHEQYPLRRGMPREELRGRLAIDGELAGALFTNWASADDIRAIGALLAVPGWTPRLTPAQESRLDEFLQALASKPYAPEPPPIDGELAAFAEAEGQAVHVGDLYFSRVAYEEMTKAVVEAAHEEPVTLAQVRDRFATSRRYAQALLEHLDQQRITRRVGDARVLREKTTNVTTS